jgi:hypothetical protein
LFLEFYSLGLGWVPRVETEEFVQKRKPRVGNGDENVRIGEIDEKSNHGQEGEDVIGQRGLEEAVFAEDVQFLSRQPFL